MSKNKNRFRIMVTPFMAVVLCVCASSFTTDNNQSQEKVYSLMMMNFARGIQWPDGAPSGKFVIGVLEYPPLAQELSAAAVNVKIGSRTVVVKEFEQAGDVSDCHILFVPAYKARSFGEVLSRLGQDPTLIVTNKIDYARKGSGVNFVLVDGKLRYEINCKAIEKRGMKISSSLKGMGIIVE